MGRPAGPAARRLNAPSATMCATSSSATQTSRCSRRVLAAGGAAAAAAAPGRAAFKCGAHASGRERNRRGAATAAAGDPTQGLVATQGQGGPGQGGQLILPQLLQWGGPLLRRVGRQWCTVAGALSQTAGWLRSLRASCLVQHNHTLLLLLLLLLLCCRSRRRPFPLPRLPTAVPRSAAALLPQVRINTPIKQHVFGKSGAYVCILEEQRVRSRQFYNGRHQQWQNLVDCAACWVAAAVAVGLCCMLGSCCCRCRCCSVMLDMQSSC